ncbi:hypothetical protein RA280_19625 [Cupriavidus sp. CV2]|uniref:hypothetical protein n=1 Tax=Cupriavidus ulmosensis TaxID=3065913 RepID=UPI00296B1B66|nr:hypothetical protein [Cupriavidus sp. CV2]MDW3683913.1 hypothetical protein [Cupriavidus sp. CV2]
MKIELHERHALLVPEDADEMAALHQIVFQRIESVNLIDRLPDRAKLMLVLGPDLTPTQSEPVAPETRSPAQIARESPKLAVGLFSDWLESQDELSRDGVRYFDRSKPCP